MREDGVNSKQVSTPLRLKARAPRRSRWEPLLVGVLVLFLGVVVWVLQENVKRFSFSYSVAAETVSVNKNAYSMRTASLTLKVERGDLRLIITDYLRKTEFPIDYYDITLLRFDRAPIRVSIISRKLITRNLAQDYGGLDRSSQPYIVGKWDSYKVLGNRLLNDP